MNKQRQKIIDSAVQEVIYYTQQYSINNQEAYKDWLGEAPTETWLAKAVAETVGATYNNPWEPGEYSAFLAETL